MFCACTKASSFLSSKIRSGILATPPSYGRPRAKASSCLPATARASRSDFLLRWSTRPSSSRTCSSWTKYHPYIFSCKVGRQIWNLQYHISPDYCIASTDVIELVLHLEISLSVLLWHLCLNKWRKRRNILFLDCYYLLWLCEIYNPTLMFAWRMTFLL
jgi:hypothetical protein